MSSVMTTSTAASPILLTAKLYEARDAMRFLFGEKYADRVKPIMNQLNQLAAAWQTSPTETLIRALSAVQSDGAGGVDQAMVIAAYVEDVEGTFKKL
jgi:hypothetical protein